MHDEKRSEIVYEEGWRGNLPVSLPEQPPEDTPGDPEPGQDAQPSEQSGIPLLLTIRLIVCLVLALTLFLLKTVGSDYYDRFMDFYREELQKTVVTREVFDAADVSRLFANGGVTIRETPDEAARR